MKDLIFNEQTFAMNDVMGKIVFVTNPLILVHEYVIISNAGYLGFMS